MAAADILVKTASWFARRRLQLRRIGLVAALTVFVAGLVLAVRSVPDIQDNLHLAPFLLLLFAALPLTIVLNAAETSLMFRMAGNPVGGAVALETTIYGSAANLLPIPGGVLVRAGALKAGGVGVKRSSVLIAAFALVWAGVAFGFSGAALAYQHQLAVAVAFGALAIAACVAFTALFRKAGARWAHVGQAIVVRTLSLLLESIRLMLAASAVGAPLSLGHTAAFAIASFVGSGVSVVPAGLGVREAVIAGLAPLVGAPAADGFLLAATDRIATMLALAAATGCLSLAHRRHGSK